MKKKLLYIGLAVLVFYMGLVLPFLGGQAQEDKTLRVATEESVGGKVWWYVQGAFSKLLPQTAYASTTADYVTDGTADDVQIQAAITALPTNGGSITLSAGSFYVSTTVDLVKRVHFQGAGKYATIIYIANNVNDDLFASSTGSDSLEINDLTLDGNKANNAISGSGIIATGITGGNIHNITIGNFREYGIYHTGGSMNWRLDAVVIGSNEKDNFSWSGGGSIWLDECYFLASTINSLSITSANDIWISNSAFDQSGAHQAVLTSLGNVWITNSYFGAGTLAGANGLYIATAIDNLHMSGNRAYQNAGNGFYIGATVTDSTIIGNDSFDNGQWGWRSPGATYVNTILIGNTAYSNGSGDWSTSELGTGAVYIHNLGLTTNATGASVGTGAQQTIAHGLSFTPTKQQIGVFADNSTGTAYQSASPDATNIYVTEINNSAWHWGTIGQ